MAGTEYTQETLSRLPREELRRMLTAELHKDASDADDAFVRLLLTELQARGSDPVFTDDDAVVSACEKFQADVEKAQKPRKRWYHSWMVTAASVVLVLGILFFALPSVAQAGNIKAVLGWWSDSVFQFITPGEKPLVQEYVFETDHPGLQQLYETITELGITEPIVPSWIPAGFALTELKVQQIAEVYEIYAKFTSEEQHILIIMIPNLGKVAFQHEKDENLVNIWDLAGREHYVMSNINEQVVTWMANGIECTITTDCTKEDVYKIIKSIYTSED